MVSIQSRMEISNAHLFKRLQRQIVKYLEKMANLKIDSYEKMGGKEMQNVFKLLW